jgi:hypothetical protein
LHVQLLTPIGTPFTFLGAYSSIQNVHIVAYQIYIRARDQMEERPASKRKAEAGADEGLEVHKKSKAGALGA